MTLGPGEGSREMKPNQLAQDPPYPVAMEGWRLRHPLDALRTYASLEPHVSDNVKALRDHIVVEEGGVARLAELLVAGAASTTVPGSLERLDYAAEQIEEALDAGSPAKKDFRLDLALQDADASIRFTVEGYERRALRVPGVTEAFAREVLVDEPLYSKDPLSEQDLAELIAFEDGPGRTKEWKLYGFGELLYHMHTSIDPEGIRMIFTGPPSTQYGKNAREIVDSGSTEENKQLLDWARGLRGMTAS